jgi:hypothetical protein
VQRRHKKREGKAERDIARVFYMRLSPVRLKIQFNSKKKKKGSGVRKGAGVIIFESLPIVRQIRADRLVFLWLIY